MSYKTKSKFACEFNFDQLSISLMTLTLLIVIISFDADVIVFDTKMLNITKVTSNIDKDIAYMIGPEDPILGSPLTIPINPEKLK